MERWRVYIDDAAPGIVEVGLERLTQRRRLLGYREVAEERLFMRWFGARDRVASGSYRATRRRGGRARRGAAERVLEARKRAHDAAELSRILRSQD
jgi:hypothetical protein